MDSVSSWIHSHLPFLTKTSIKWAIPSLIAIAGFIGIRKWAAGGVCSLSHDMSEEVVLITGGNCGIGFETAKELARWGATVVLAVRDVESGLNAARIIMRSLEGNIAFKSKGRVLVEYMDLTDIESINQFAKKFETLCYGRLNHLILNAGIMETYVSSPQFVKVNGKDLDRTFVVNTLGHFVLVEALEALIWKNGTRVITVSSALHKHARLQSVIPDERVPLMMIPDLGGELPGATDSQQLRKMAYCKSKLAGLHIAYKWAKEFETSPRNVTTSNENGGVKKPISVALHPGVVRSRLARSSGQFREFIFHFVLRFIGKSSWEGCQTTLYCVAAPNIKNAGYYGDCHEKLSSLESYNGSATDHTWNYCHQLINP